MAITPKSEDKYVEKCSTAQSFIFPKWHSFKIGTLTGIILSILTKFEQSVTFYASLQGSTHQNEWQIDNMGVSQQSTGTLLINACPSLLYKRILLLHNMMLFDRINKSNTLKPKFQYKITDFLWKSKFWQHC